MSQPHSDTTPRSSVLDHPVGFWFFFWGEFAERCCYYGMRAILLLYMTQILKFADGEANRTLSYYIAACYFLPLVGGYVADNFLGKYRTIVYFAIPYIFGQVLLGIESLHNETCLYLSLGLLAMGSGVIKPNVSTLMGMTYDQQRPGRTKLRSDAFAIFYGSINIGAAISSFCVPWIRTYYGSDSRAYAIAFLFPAGLMVLAFVVFALGKPFYAKEKIERVRLTPEDRRSRMVVLRRLFGLFFVVTIFWSIFDQSACTWTLFARDFLHLQFFGLSLSPDQLQSINPILILVLLPPITMLWHLLAHFGFDLKPTGKMLIGFLLTTITMAITTWAAFRGADAIVAGAKNALSQADKTVAAADQMTGNAQVDGAVRGLLKAVSFRRTSAMLEEQCQTELDAALKSAKRAGPAAVAAAAARQAAAAAVDAADAAMDMGPGAKLEKTILRAKTAAEAAQTVAEALGQAVKLATEAAQDTEAGQPTGVPAGFRLSDCSNAANRVEAAAAAVNKAMDAAKNGNTRATQINAAVAAVDSADAAVLAAAAVADIKAVNHPGVIAETEKAVAAARISLWWQIIPYILITMSEICISVVGLELAFAAAPATMKSFVTACWFLTVCFGDILNAQITPLYNKTFWGVSLTPDWFFLMFALLMIPVVLAFALVAKRFNRPVGEKR
jgi:solute carrier family 15 (oligopeptide transporter), member 1